MVEGEALAVDAEAPALARPAGLAVAVPGVRVLHVGAGAEHAAGAAQDHDLDVVVGRELVEVGAHLLAHRRVVRVAPLGVVDRDPRHVRGPIDVEHNARLGFGFAGHEKMPVMRRRRPARCRTGTRRGPRATVRGPAASLTQRVIDSTGESEANMIRSLPRVDMKCSSDAGRWRGDHAEVMSRRLAYLIIRRIAVSHHGSAPCIMQSLSSGKRTQTRSRWIGFCASPGIGGPGRPGVHAQRQVELAALRVEREVDGVGRRVHAVAPEARADDRVRDRVVGTKLSSRRRFFIGFSRSWPPAPRLNRSGWASTNDSARFEGWAMLTIKHGPLDAVLVHLVEQLAELAAREHRRARLEVVLLDADHPLGLLDVAHVGVDEEVVGARDGRHDAASRVALVPRHRGCVRAPHGTAGPCSGRVRAGRPSARSPITLRWISSVPP